MVLNDLMQTRFRPWGWIFLSLFEYSYDNWTWVLCQDGSVYLPLAFFPPLLLFYFCKWKLQLEYCFTANLTPPLSVVMWHQRFLSVGWFGIIKHSHIVQSVGDEQQCSEVHPTLLSSPPDPWNVTPLKG